MDLILGPVDQTSSSEAKIAIFRSLFRGRDDVYPRRFESRKTGRAGYAPACANEWVRGICEKPRIKCADCPNRCFLAVTDQVNRWHLSGTVEGLASLSWGKLGPDRLAQAQTVRYHSNMSANERTTPALCEVPCFNGPLVASLRNKLPSDARLKKVKMIFAALADEQRLKILLTLEAGRELCVCDVAHVLGASVSATSHHLRKLRDLGILEDRSDGRMTYYSLRARFVAELALEAMTAAA